jgi:hypothetical protein
MRTLLNLAKICAALAMVGILGGCAVGQSFSYADAPVVMQEVSSSGNVAVAVQDERSYVLSGNKPERFVGLMRGGFGNPFDVTTASGAPLADDMRDAIGRALKARGVSVIPVSIAFRDSSVTARRKLLDAKARRSILVTLREWKTDSLLATDIHYDATLVVLDERGEQLATSTIKGVDNLGNLGLTPHEGVHREVGRKIDKLFDDGKVIAALK